MLEFFTVTDVGMNQGANILLKKERYIPIVFSCDDNYIQHLYCALTSLFRKKHTLDKIKIFILTDSIKQENQNLLTKLCTKYDSDISFIKLDKDTFKNCPLTASCPHISIATYYRFVLPSVIPEDVNKILYLDCDITIQKSLYELYNIDIEDYYFAGVQDILYNENSKRLELAKYCNAGVMLINLRKWREENVEKRLFDWAKNNIDLIKWQDQDTINFVLQSGILYLDKIWNAQVGQYKACYEEGFNKIANKAGIIHYIGQEKPWDKKCTSPVKLPYFISLLHTPYANKIPSYITSFYISLIKRLLTVWKISFEV